MPVRPFAKQTCTAPVQKICCRNDYTFTFGQNDFWRNHTMIRYLTCPACNKQFATENNASKYCSPRCRRKMARRHAIKTKKYTCAWCGNDFLSERRKKYCSKECRQYANGRAKKSAAQRRCSPILSLSQVARLSREAGMSYGKYVHTFQLQ